MQSIRLQIVLASAIILAAGLAATPAAAETTSVKVPFSFNVAGQTFPAGDYWIERDNQFHCVTLEAKGSSQHFTSLLRPGAPPPWEHKIDLKFDTVGQAHFLESIQYGMLTTGRLDKKALEGERAQVAQVFGMCAEGQTLRAPGLAFETWETTKLRYAAYSFGAGGPGLGS